MGRAQEFVIMNRDHLLFCFRFQPQLDQAAKTLDGLANARGRGMLFHVSSGASSGVVLRGLFGQRPR
jgi:hypothetical protein